MCSFVINASICIQLFFRSHDYRQKAIALSLFVCDLYAKALDEEGSEGSGGSEGSTIVRRAKCRRPHSVEKLIIIKKIGRSSVYLQSPQTSFLDIHTKRDTPPLKSKHRKWDHSASSFIMEFICVAKIPEY